MKDLSRKLFRVKSLHTIMSESHDPTKRLKKVLGSFDLLILGSGIKESSRFTGVMVAVKLLVLAFLGGISKALLAAIVFFAYSFKHGELHKQHASHE